MPPKAPLKVVDSYSPRPLQLELHKECLKHQFNVLVCHRRFGKALDLDTPVPMADGTWSVMGELQSGERVFGADGNPTTILQAHDILYDRECFEVEFESGDVIVADAEHLWLTTQKKDRHNPTRMPDGSRPNRPRPATLRTTEQIYKTLRSRGEFNHRVPVAPAVNLPENELPIDPYLFGVWIGDGTSRNPTITTMDSEVFNQIEAVCMTQGWRIGPIKQQNAGKATTYRIKGGLATILRELGLIANKHILEVYFLSSIPQRMALLKGLTDTDGCINKQGNYCEFTQKREVTAEGFVRLLASLGIHARLSVKIVKGKPYQRMGFRPTFNPFSIEKKTVRYVDPPERQFWQSIVKVAPVKSRPVRCITVDALDGLYLVGERYTVTHNTFFTLQHAKFCAMKNHLPNPQYAYIAPLYSQAKTVAWKYLKDFVRPYPKVKYNETELHVTLPNTAQIRLFGADNPDALRGNFFDGVILDEVSQMKPKTWGEIIFPALTDRSGWAIFIGTPAGSHGLFYETFVNAQKRKNWFCKVFRADETGILSDEILQIAQDTMTESQYRQEYLCDFTASSEDIFIPMSLSSEATLREYPESAYSFAPIILGVDVARFGGDRSVICLRQGVMCKELWVYKGLDTMALADRVANKIEKFRPDAVFVDEIGIGAGVVDRLHQLNHDVVVGVNVANPAQDEKYSNKRAEIWGKTKEWLLAGGALPKEDPHVNILVVELSSQEYLFDARDRIAMVKKEDMKKNKGLPSPDVAEALCLTFSYPVQGQGAYEDDDSEYRVGSEGGGVGVYSPY